MPAFNLNEISNVTKEFLEQNENLGYEIAKIEEDDRHILFQGTNLFSLLYCQVTADVNLIESWQPLQEKLFQLGQKSANRYLVFLLPDSIVKKANLYDELAMAERDERFFRKVFIGLPDDAGRKEIESSLENRIPHWFAEKNKVIRQYIPLLNEVISDNELIELFLKEAPSEIVNEIDKNPRYAYLFQEIHGRENGIRGLKHSLKEDTDNGQGTRIKELRLRNFRRFREKTIKLQADVVLIYGQNGTGKTTICDALELSIFPELRRLHGDPDLVISQSKLNVPFIRVGSEEKKASITLIGSSGNDEFKLDTIVTPHKTAKFLNGNKIEKNRVVGFLTRNREIGKKGLLDILLHTHFLGQHSIRDFIYGNRLDDKQKITTTRYNLIAEMFGFGEVEALKKRLSTVLSQIKRGRTNDLQRRIDDVKRQLRSSSRKYGPKRRESLEKSGHVISAEYAIEKYRQILHRLEKLLEPGILEQVPECEPPIENYLAACSNVRNLLLDRLKKIQSQDADLKRLDQLIMKTSTILQEIPLNEKTSISSFIEAVRKKIDAEIRDAENTRREIETTKNRIDKLNLDLRQLQQFIENHEHYLELCSTKQELSKTLDDVQRTKRDLLWHRNDVQARLSKTEIDEQNATKGIQQNEVRVLKYEALLKSLAEAKASDRTIKENTDRIIEIDKSIAESEQRLKNIRSKTHGSRATDDARRDILDYNCFHANGEYACPCCGAKYSDAKSIENSIRIQLDHGEYSRELEEFLKIMFERNVKSGAAVLEESILLNNENMLELERQNRALDKKLVTFKTLLFELGEKETVSEQVLRKRIENYAKQSADFQRVLAENQAETIQGEIKLIESQIQALKEDVHRTRLEEIRKETRHLALNAKDLLSDHQLMNKNEIQTQIDQKTKDLEYFKNRLEHLFPENQKRGMILQREGEIDANLTKIESILLRQKSLDVHPPLNLAILSDKNLHNQREYYNLSSDIDDILNLFGVLTAQERSDNLKKTIEMYERQKEKWLLCYDNFDFINTQLSEISYTGLQKGLAEYGPLINHVYLKFTRHDYFSELVLDPTSSKKGRRRDLYLRLKSYSGDEQFTPASYLSEAQLNILALSIFLTRVMYQNISALETIFIDDPIQQMDDLNATAFVDVILGLSQIGKQIIITTCNHDFYRLVTHKLQGTLSQNDISFIGVNLDLREK